MIEYIEHDEVICGKGIINSLGTKIYVYLYLIDGLLIDTGPKNLFKDSIEFFNNNKIDKIVLTHLHEDHSGMASWLQNNYKNILIYIHSSSVSNSSKKAKIPFYRKIFWGNRLAFNPIPLENEIKTNKYSFQIIHTPGHSSDHIALHEPQQGWLFTGDLFLGKKQVVCMREEVVTQTIESLKKIITLDFDTIFCAHSGVHKNGKELMQYKLDFFLDLQAKVKDLRNQGLSPRSIRKKLYPKVVPITYISCGEWSSYNIINSLYK